MSKQTLRRLIRATNSLVAFGILGLVGARGASAQNQCGPDKKVVVSGSVEDRAPSGRVIPAVHVRVALVDANDKVVANAFTGSGGAYSFAGVRCGHYKIQVWAHGKARVERNVSVAKIPRVEVQPIDLWTG